jgi:hypothetical protein
MNLYLLEKFNTKCEVTNSNLLWNVSCVLFKHSPLPYYFTKLTFPSLKSEIKNICIIQIMCGVDSSHKFPLQEILLIKMNIWNLIHEEIKTSLNFTNKHVLTNLLDHLIIVTKTYDPPLLPQSNLKMPKTQYIN